MFNIDRPVIAQPIFNFAWVVPAANPVPLYAVAQSLVNSLFDSFILSIPLDEVNDPPTTRPPIYLGRSNVTAGIASNGIQVRPGVPVQFSIEQPEQQYELQVPLVQMACADKPIEIPFVVWNVADIYGIADSDNDPATDFTTVGVWLLKAAWK